MPSAFLAYYVHNMSPFLVRFSEGVGIRYYGLAYVLGFVVGAWLLVRYTKTGRSRLSVERVSDLLMALMVGVYVGGRVGHFVFYDGLSHLHEDPWALFKVWEGGMAFHGGLLGVVAAIYLFCRFARVPFLPVGDLVSSVVPVGLLFGRLANFVNGELWGKPSEVPWAVIFPQSALFGEALVPRHPSQLYEAALEGLLLLAFLQWRFWRSDVVSRTPGRLSGEFLVGYGLARIVCEVFREPDAGISPILGLSRGTFYSAFLVLSGVALWVWSGRKKEGPAS